MKGFNFLSRNNQNAYLSLQRKAKAIKESGKRVPKAIQGKIDAYIKMAQFLYDTRKLS